MARYKKHYLKGDRDKRRIAVWVLTVAGVYALIFSGNAKAATLGMAPVIPAIASVFWCFRRRRYITNPRGCHGILNSDVRPPLARGERLQLLSDLKRGVTRHASME